MNRTEHPFGLVVISGIAFIDGFWILLLLGSNNAYLISLGLMLSVLFFGSGFYLLRLENLARVILVMLFFLGVIMDIIYVKFGPTQILSIVLTIIIISYLLSPKISKMFVD